MVVFYVVSMIRGFLPLDFQKAIVIPDKIVYPRIYAWLIAVRGSVLGQDITCLGILVTVWIVGIIADLYQYIVKYARTIYILNINAQPANERVINIFHKLLRDDGNGPVVSIYEVEKLSSPCGIGVFKKRILIPTHTYTDDELYFVLKHEYTHFLNHDIFLKQLAMLFSVVFWWNPIAYLLKSGFEQALELRCDVYVTKEMTKSEKVNYLFVILKTMKTNNEILSNSYTTTGLSKNLSDIFFKERFDTIIRQIPGKAKSILLTICYIALLGFSYFIIIQPHTDAPENAIVDFDKSNSYIIHTSDNEFWLYRSNFYPTKISETETAFYESIGFDIIEV